MKIPNWKRDKFLAHSPRANLVKIDSGLSGTKQTLARMWNLALDGAKDPSIRQFAGYLVRGGGGQFRCAIKDYWCEASVIFEWIKTNIRWTRDINGVETLQTPARTLNEGYGDCDDLSVLLVSLLRSIGFDARFRAVAADADRKSQYSHVYVVVEINDEWVPADPSVDKELGWEHSTGYKYMNYPPID